MPFALDVFVSNESILLSNIWLQSSPVLLPCLTSTGTSHKLLMGLMNTEITWSTSVTLATFYRDQKPSRVTVMGHGLRTHLPVIVSYFIISLPLDIWRFAQANLIRMMLLCCYACKCDTNVITYWFVLLVRSKHLKGTWHDNIYFFFRKSLKNNISRSKNLISKKKKKWFFFCVKILKGNPKLRARNLGFPKTWGDSPALKLAILQLHTWNCMT